MGSYEYLSGDKGNVVVQNEIENFSLTNRFIPPTGNLLVNKFNDLNKNGVFDENERLMPNWDLSLQSNEGSKQTKTTNELGSVLFSVNPGTYTISETQQAGWEQTNIYCESGTKPGEAYWHHGICEGWNGCKDAETCALWACNINGYSNLISYGEEKPCTESENCRLFYSQNNIQWNWGNSSSAMGVTDIVCGKMVIRV